MDCDGGIENMKIAFVDKRLETVYSCKFTESPSRYSTGRYALTGFCTNAQPIGTILFDFIETDFCNEKCFDEFIDKYGYAGFISFSNTIKRLVSRPRNQKYKNKLNRNLQEKNLVLIEELAKAQVIFKEAIDFCIIINGTSELQGLTSIEKFFIYQITYRNKLLEEYNKNIVSSFYAEQTSKTVEVAAYFNNLKLPLSELAKAVKDYDVKLKEEYISGNITELLYIVFRELLSSNNVKYAKCVQCGQYFIAGRTDVEFCSNCKQTGPVHRYLKKMNPVQAEFNKKYKKQHAKYVKHEMTDEEFDKWLSEARHKKELAKTGKMSPDEFFEWLKL